jgi:catechol 2,3-dioxygenase-like lactoylglutathione lyase family enzyme
MSGDVLTVNLILYSADWERTVGFYRDGLELPVGMENDWFVEFRVGGDSRLSIADERRASIKSCGGGGVTVALEVADIDAAWQSAKAKGLSPTEVRDHPWNARVFYLVDPDGHRVELWESIREDSPQDSGR